MNSQSSDSRTRCNTTLLWSAAAVVLALLAGCGPAGSAEIEPPRIRLEHVALNVQDPVAMAQWYVTNLGMKIVRTGPAPVHMHFLSDSAGNMMLEIYHNPPEAVPDYAKLDPLNLHVAFMVDDVRGFSAGLLKAGATVAQEYTVTPGGDELIILRDPWGLPIQFVKRKDPMLHFGPD